MLSLRGVSKRFGAVRALDDVSFEVAAGEVVALVGDNGAGKSTLIQVMSGTLVPDTAEVRFDGREVSLGSPADASRLGVATVYQDLALCDNLDVVANLHLGHETHAAAVLSEVEMERRAVGLLDELSVRVPSLRTPVGMLSGGQRQCIAIARTLLGAPRVVLLDEPTAALGLVQKEQVLDLVRRLKARGLGVVLISHNMAEVFAVADRVIVLRLGRRVATLPAVAEQQQAVVAAITGADGGIPVAAGGFA
nr:ATP-binding cassette domain-containing protein [Conexibacter arvalis]